MTAQPLDAHTYVPAAQDQIAEVLTFIRGQASGSAETADRYFLAGAHADDQVELPEPVYRALLLVVEAMAEGRAVTVSPQNQTLTTQQAADLLGISRPTVVKLIETGDLPAETPGTSRRMIRLDDVLAYQERRRANRYAALIDIAASDPYELDVEPDVTADQIQLVRAEIAARRQARTAI